MEQLKQRLGEQENLRDLDRITKAIQSLLLFTDNSELYNQDLIKTGLVSQNLVDNINRLRYNCTTNYFETDDDFFVEKCRFMYEKIISLDCNLSEAYEIKYPGLLNLIINYLKKNKHMLNISVEPEILRYLSERWYLL